MKGVLNWVKGNPILIAAAIACLLAFSGLVVVQMQGGGFVSKMKSRDSKIGEIKNLLRTKVTLPPEKPDGQPLSLDITVNPAAIEAIEKIYGRMSDEYIRIFREATQVNQQGHIPMLPKLFPAPDDDEMYLLYDARHFYKDAFADMFKNYSRSSLYPRLNAGGPVPLERLDEAVARAQDEFLGHFRTLSDLDEAEQEELNRKKTAAVIAEMTAFASKCSIYANSDPTSGEYPFDVMSWSNKLEQPNLAEVWEGQMGLWIQQDIVKAIGDTNKVASTESSVINAPIKRLFSISVGNRYVGLDLKTATVGGAGAAGGAAAGGAGIAEPDYAQSPTGRTSNEIFDVRHVRVHMLMDWRRITDFMGALARTNFMTVLDVDVEDVDEYAALQGGYLYGNGDVVDVVMVIESLWLREWTTDLMPDLVKQAMSIPIEQPETNPTN